MVQPSKTRLLGHEVFLVQPSKTRLLYWEPNPISTARRKRSFLPHPCDPAIPQIEAGGRGTFDGLCFLSVFES